MKKGESSVKVLFIAGHEFLYNPQNGGQQCSLRNYNLLKSIFGDSNVYLCMFSNYKYEHLNSNEKIFPTHRNFLELLIDTISGRNVCGRKSRKKAVEFINSLNVDIIFCDSSTIGKILRDIKISGVRIVFFHNIEKNYAKNKVLHDNFGYLIPYFSYSCNERQAVAAADYCVFLNDRDRMEAEELYGTQKSYILPITFGDAYVEKTKDFSDRIRPVLLFVGSLFAPNISGIKWFVEEVMPELGDFVLYIVGKNMENRKKELERDNVKVIGTVEDLSVYYNLADAVIMPIFFGNGMKVKTAEAMMYGKTTFATKEALEGYDIEPVRDRGIYECNTKEEFVEKIKKNVSVRSTINQQVRQIFLEKYETGVQEKNFQSFLMRCIKEQGRDAETME